MREKYFHRSSRVKSRTESFFLKNKTYPVSTMKTVEKLSDDFSKQRESFATAIQSNYYDVNYSSIANLFISKHAECLANL